MKNFLSVPGLKRNQLGFKWLKETSETNVRLFTLFLLVISPILVPILVIYKNWHAIYDDTKHWATRDLKQMVRMVLFGFEDE